MYDHAGEGSATSNTALQSGAQESRSPALFSSNVVVSLGCDGRICAWNPTAQRVLGYFGAEVLGRSLDAVCDAVADCGTAWPERMLERAAKGGAQPVEVVAVRRDGVRFGTRVLATPQFGVDGALAGYLVLFEEPAHPVAAGEPADATPVSETTEQGLLDRDREIARLTGLYMALSRVNQAIVWSSSRDQLFEDICRALVEAGGFGMAWIGWNDDAANLLVPVAHCGDDLGYLQSVRIRTDDSPEGRGPSGVAFRSGIPFVCNDLLAEEFTAPWREEFERRGYRSSAAFPIRLGGATCGTLNVYAGRRGFFQDREIGLLEEAARDISFALDNFARDEARRRTERVLLDEKRFSDTMIESMPGVFYFYDSRGHFLRWNRNFERVTGCSAEEVARSHPRDFFVGLDRTRVEGRIAEVFDRGESSVEADLVNKDGVGTPYFLTGRRVIFDGQPCLLGVGIDISELRCAEERLASSERKYRELVQHANSIILRWDVQGRVLFLNEFGQRFFGYGEDEIVGRHVTETIVPPTESGGRNLVRMIDDILADPEAFEQNVNENLCRDGSRVWIAWTNRIVRDDKGRATEFLSVGTDITERRRAEAALREAELRFHTLFEQTPVGVVVIDPQTSAIVQCNRRAAEQLGYTTAELTGMKAADIEAPESVADVAGRIERLLAGHTVELETRHRTKAGEIRDVFVSGHVLELGGRPTIQCVALDITDRVRIEAEREKRHRAEAADRIKSAFLATMSHELRTPLNSIIGFTGIVLQGLAGPLNDEQTRQLGMVRSSARHLLDLINDVLDISKIEAGQLEVRHEPFPLRAAIDRVAGIVETMAQRKGLRLETAVDPQLQEITSDRRRVEQVLLNLLSNAVKFTERGGVSLVVDFVPGHRFADDAAPKRAVRIAVADTGIGIREEDLGRLFQPFRQLDSGLTRLHEGTGLGLAICRRLMDLLGGEISAASTPGVGSRFTVILPVGEDN